MPSIQTTGKNTYTKTLITVLVFASILTAPSLLVSKDHLDNTADVRETYGANPLFAKPPFQGGYINFGYWKGINLDKKITVTERIRASRALYELVIDQIGVDYKAPMNCVEVGSGIGLGCVLLKQKFENENVIGVDVTLEQTERASKLHKNMSFLTASSSQLPFEDRSQDIIYSVEAAQCFPSLIAFAAEAERVLKPGGKVILAAHFSVDEQGYENTKKLLPTVAQGIDRMVPISEVKKAFLDQGFKLVKFAMLGSDVFPGFDKWLSQVDDVPWGRSVHKLYKL